MDEVDILEKLVSFNTIKDKENKEILEYIEKFCLNYGFKTVYKDKILVLSNNSNNKNLDDIGIGFVGHTDTVGAKEWKYDPFKLTRKGNKLIGLGTCDMKGGISCILEAITKIDFSNLKKKMILVFTYDEEIGFNGIKDFLKLNIKMPNRIIIGEPTYNEVYLGSKGLQEYKVTFKGKSSHSSTPFKGKNAILDGIRFIEEINQFYEKEIRNDLDEDYDIPYTTFNVGTINGGQAINIVADNCEVKFDFRTIPQNEEIVSEYVKETIKKYDANFEIINQIKAYKSTSRLFNEFKIAPFITEASFLEGERIILGPGPMNPHEKDEYVEFDSLKKCINEYISIIKESCK